MSFHLATEQQLMISISILNESGDAVELIILELCKLFSCRAFDTSSGEFFKVLEPDYFSL